MRLTALSKQKDFDMQILAEGKTKIIMQMPDEPNLVVVNSKNDITGGNGARHEKPEGKGELANRTTCNVFQLLKRRGMPVSFREKRDLVQFVAEKCTMLPYEVVVRSEAHGSYLKRYPKVKKGDKFNQLVVEIFLKTSGKAWKGHGLICDDPLMVIGEGAIHLYDPAAEMASQKPFLTLAMDMVFTQPNELELISRMASLARQTFSILKEAWAALDCNLVDFKVEFGINAVGALLLSDVIDNDSWRLVKGSSYLDKQNFRDGEEVARVMEDYRKVADLSDKFAGMAFAA